MRRRVASGQNMPGEVAKPPRPELLTAVGAGSGGGLWDRPQELLAGFGAAAAAVGAGPAVLVLLSVPVALLGADEASRPARFELTADEARVGLGLAREDAPGGGADVGTVEVEPDAAAEHPHLLFCEAGIGAGDAALLAFEAGVDTGDQRVEVADGVGVLGEDLLGDHKARRVGER